MTVRFGAYEKKGNRHNLVREENKKTGSPQNQVWKKGVGREKTFERNINIPRRDSN